MAVKRFICNWMYEVLTINVWKPNEQKYKTSTEELPFARVELVFIFAPNCAIIRVMIKIIRHRSLPKKKKSLEIWYFEFTKCNTHSEKDPVKKKSENT